MQTKTTFKFLSASLTALILAGCGGGSGSALDNTLNGGGTTNSTTNWRIGNGIGTSFVSGSMGVVNTEGNALYVGGTANLTVTIVNESGALISDAIPIEFSSPCLSSGKSKLVGGTKVSAATGSVTVQYQPSSCIGDDLVTATAVYKDKTQSTSATVKVSNLRLGLGSGVDFVPTKLDLGANSSAMFTDQITTLSVNIVNDSGNLIQASVPVTFTSSCINAGTSTITGGNVINSTAGVAKAEYKAGSCFGDDVVKASITYAGSVISSSATIPQVNNKRIGSGAGTSFTPGQLTTSTSNTLFEGDTTQISANIVNNQSNLISQATQVVFDSPCLSAGLSSIAGGNIVTSINGTARIQYKVGKCDIDDKVTATISNGDGTIDASVSLPIDTRRLGSGFGSNFVIGALELGIGIGSLSPGGSTSITAYIVNSKGDLVTDPMNVTFSSPCISAGNAVITGGNTVTSVNGKAVATYTSQGCAGVGGVDAIKASTTFRSVVLNASADLTVKSDTAQTISFIDSDTPLISIKGTGGDETAILRFRVLGQGGSPLKGVCVNFAPSTTIGGLALVPSKCNPAGPETYGSSTDANGYASTTVQAGTVATAVRVTATTANGLSTQSSSLAVSTGIPDQNSMSLSLSDIAPNAWKYDGISSTATIRLADAFNNPVPDDTVVAFTTNGGSIEPNCPTTNGACSVTWRSQSPRPTSPNAVSFATTAPFAKICPAIKDLDNHDVTECRSGRVTILATAIGNESFIDGNGNGIYDDVAVDTFSKHKSSDAADANKDACNPSVPLSSAAIGATKGCDDLPEAYLDGNSNNYRTRDEEFIDFNQNGTHDAGNSKYDGALCSGTAKTSGACTTNKVTVRDSITLVMACETPFLQSGVLPGQSNIDRTTDSFNAIGAVVTRQMLLADCNGNGMPAGTTVTVDTSGAVGLTATVSPSGGLAKSFEPSIITLTAKATTNTPSGNIVLEIKSGSITSLVTINVSD
ncbi:hypothetical protein GCM10011613_24460 [Cellvibrio zantedeschiae]|uniref:Big-1 domain-containing protein n=1 Tax=Cellvibrio zantedeschiae TaxID=1237077 RepID=A0ABQ3B4F6_9GAMM|nr:hypothetical protein [Cellvibrio zantedeschiae]GGY78807.1 hypothetical protein GCM10011613_24460 [Cellvibrio zantedeschiae]